MPEINWVNERFKCSLVQMFEQLKADIGSDVDERNKQLPPNSGFKFQLGGVQGNRFSVIREDTYEHFAHRSVVFVLEQNKIRALEGTNRLAELMSATITFNDLGECRFKVNGKERESWQFRKETLENLFFE